jgi:glycerol-3-phosphate acyltransferase PlsY
MVMVGHIWPIYTKFNGGKGIAVGLAVCFMLSPISGLAAIIIALPLIFITKYVSLGSIAGSISSGIVLCYLSTIGAQHHPSYCIFAVLGPALAILLHKSNIINLINGQERKFGDRTEITRQ